MFVNLEDAPDVNPVARQADDELLLILGPAPTKERSGWVNELLAQSYESLGKSYNYSEFKFGFQGQGGKKPYAIVEWKDAGNNALERRWVFARLIRHLLAQYNCKKVMAFLEVGTGAEQLIMIEDLVTANTSALYEKSRWLYVKILSANVAALKKADPKREIRQKYQWQYRSWINENPDELTSLAMGDRIAHFARSVGAEFTTFDEKQLAEMGLNLLVAVGQASKKSPSRLHVVTNNLRRGNEAPLLLVGKGVTFDTGGINLKPHEGFVNCMKNDMGGAALMASLFMALVESGYDKPLALAIPCCENLIDANSVKPGAIIQSLSGKKVIIEHTDAEGRLILADAIHYAQKSLAPKETWTAATLTTASLRQFTNFFTPTHFAPVKLRNRLDEYGDAFGECFTHWGSFLPFANGNKTKAADLTNMGRMPANASIGGGSNVAAHFLKEFSSGPLVHFDIFASAWNWSNDYPGAHYGATGAPFNSLFSSLLP